jgi:hypothetical protein
VDVGAAAFHVLDNDALVTAHSQAKLQLIDSLKPARPPKIRRLVTVKINARVVQASPRPCT